MSDIILLDETFYVNKIDTSRYDRVSRIEGKSQAGDLQITLDVNTQIYPLENDDTIFLQIVTTLNPDGSDSKTWRAQKSGERSLADDWEYVCYGKIYRFDEGKDDKVEVYISFGGLLLRFEGSYRKLSKLSHENVYLLIRK